LAGVEDDQHLPAKKKFEKPESAQAGHKWMA
jgi:hypothetical protein